MTPTTRKQKPNVKFEATPHLDSKIYKSFKPIEDMSKKDYSAKIKQIQNLKKSFARSNEYLQLIDERCSKISQHDQLLNNECLSAWLYHLQNGEITNVIDLLGFEETHYGAIILEVDHTYKAVFKPCSTIEEDTSNEVVASHIDQILGYGQTAPVITREINPDTLFRFVANSPQNKQTLLQTIERCKTSNEVFQGPMIGWWDGLTPIRTVRKSKVGADQMPQMRANLTYNLLTTQMQSRFHSFYWLIAILRHGKDEFITPQANLVSLDLDRSQFLFTTPPTDISLNFTWCYTCYFDEWTYQSFLAVGPGQPQSRRLSYLLQQSLSSEEVFSNIFNQKMGDVVDLRISHYLNCVDSCIHKYGKENVLLNYRSDLTSNEIIDWFVYHSEYKNQNGKRPPKWFNPLKYFSQINNHDNNNLNNDNN